MNKTIHVQPLSKIARIADALLIPFMYLISGTLSEAPQRTHRWNNIRLSANLVAHLDYAKMVHCRGITSAMRRINPIYHMQIFGGWRDYVVLAPANHSGSWHAGWITHDVTGVSKIALQGPARTLIGPGDVSFFGINAKTGEQIQIIELARGRVGKRGLYAKTPLL